MKDMDIDKDEPEIDELNDDDDDDDFTDDEDGDNKVYAKAVHPAIVKMQTTYELHRSLHQGEIDLSPPYQRDVVWPEKKSIGLVDSIFRNFFIPPVIFAVTKDSDGTELRVCVDGKQRLTSIQMFFDGQIPHRHTKTKERFWYTMSDSARSTKTELPEEYKALFRSKAISVVEYHGLEPGEEREIFQRVQLGMSLTAAEKLQAIASPWAEWIASLEKKHVAIEEGLADKLHWNIKRGRDFQNIAHMVFCCDGYPEEHLPTAQKIEKWISREDKPQPQFQADIESVLRTMWIFGSDPRYGDAFTRIKQMVAPVEFIFIGVLLYALRKQDRAVQARATYTLRYTIRQEFKDIRNNTVVAKALWKHVYDLCDNPMASHLSLDTAVKGKRKRASDIRDDDDEFRPSPVKGLGKGARTRTKKIKS